MKASTVRMVTIVAGLALVVGFFLPWIDLGIGPNASGLDVVRHTNGASFFRLMVLAVPIGGVAMAFCAFTNSKYTKLVSVLTGLTLVGYGIAKIVQTFFAISGFGLWLVIAASFAALAVPLLADKER